MLNIHMLETNGEPVRPNCSSLTQQMLPRVAGTDEPLEDTLK